jgi:tetratricopeptide (TPR) repeat protein
MIVVSCTTVTKASIFHKSTRGLLFIGLTFFVLALHPCKQARAEGVQVGGDSNKVRIVFTPKEAITPDIVSEERTLIVNFPNIVGAPSSVKDFFIIKELDFDGSLARITLNAPYRYKTSFLSNPVRFVIDITINLAGAAACPLASIDSITRQDGIAVTLHIKENKWPRILHSRAKGRVYLIFDGEVNCESLKDRVTRIPFINYAGTIKTQGGTAVLLSISDTAKGLTIREFRQNLEITLDISTKETIDLGKLFAIAQAAYDHDDVAAVINELKPFSVQLTPEARTLLARAYWRIAYPSNETLYREAVKLMAQGIGGMNPGLERERLMLEYAAMLIATNALDDARKFVRFLRDSESDEVAINAYILEVELLNKRKQSDDAFIAGKRMQKIFDINIMPKKARASFYAAVGDSYLGLNDYGKALDMYTKAIAEDPGVLQRDIELYARMGDAAFKKNDFAKAKYYILQSINLGDPREKTMQLLKLGDCLYQMGDIRKSIEVYSQVGSIASEGENIAIAKLRKAQILIDNDLKDDGKLSTVTFFEVIGIYDSIQIPPNTEEGSLVPIVKIRKAQLYAKHGNWDLAFATYNQCWLETKPEDPLHKYALTEGLSHMISRMKDLLVKQDYRGILDIYAKYKDSFFKDIRDPEALLLLAQAMVHLGQDINARPLLILCMQRSSPSRAAALATLCDVDFKLGYMNEALRWNTIYLNDYPQGEAINHIKEVRGTVLYRLNNLQEALFYLDLVSKTQDAKALNALYMLSDAYHKLNDSVKEGEALEKMITLSSLLQSPLIEWAMYMRAGQLKARDMVQAKALYDTLLTAYPSSKYRWGATYNIAAILYRQGYKNGARAMFSRVIQLSNDILLVKASRTFIADMDLRASMAEVNPGAAQVATDTTSEPVQAADETTSKTPKAISENTMTETISEATQTTLVKAVKGTAHNTAKPLTATSRKPEVTTSQTPKEVPRPSPKASKAPPEIGTAPAVKKADAPEVPTMTTDGTTQKTTSAPSGKTANSLAPNTAKPAAATSEKTEETTTQAPNEVPAPSTEVPKAPPEIGTAPAVKKADAPEVPTMTTDGTKHETSTTPFVNAATTTTENEPEAADKQ